MANEVDRTLWVGNLSEKVNDELLYELFLQAGPLDKVVIPREKDGGRQKNFAFVTFSHDVSVPYTIQMMDGMQLFGRPLRLQSRPGSIHNQQQQQQQGQVQAPYRNSDNMSNQHRNLPVNMVNLNQLPPNPYGMNQPMASSPVHQPLFQRSNTWHGGDQSSSSGQMERDYYERRGDDRGRDRGHYSGQSSRDSRDRSNSRHREDRGNNRTDQGRDSYRNSPNSYADRETEDFDSKRQRVLQKHDKALQNYRRDHNSRQHYGKHDNY